IFFTEIQIGRINYDLKRYEEARKWLNRGIEGYKSLDDMNDKMLAHAYSTLAFIAEEEGTTSVAENYYNISDNHYSRVYKDKFDFIYLDFLTHLSEFYSLNNYPDKAIEFSHKALDYISNAYTEQSLVGFRQILNVGKVYFNLKNYKQSLQYAEKGLALLENLQNSPKST